MARYLMQIGLTPQAMAALVRHPQDRLKTNRRVFERVGGTLDEYWFAAGEPTIYVVAHLPDTVTLEALTMAVLAGGAVNSIKTTAILTSAEAIDSMRKASSAGYAPPEADYSVR